MNVRVEKNDISIAHRLPSKNGTPKPVIARFTRRVTKIQLLTKKKNLHGNALLGNVRIYEDATKARENFMNLLRSDDERINKAWIREGTIFLDWKNNEHRKKHGLYEGAELVQYSYETVIKCFETKWTNRTDPAYESKNRREKLHDERPQPKTRTLKTLTILKTEIIATKEKFTPHGCKFIQTIKLHTIQQIPLASKILDSSHTLNVLRLNVRSLKHFSDLEALILSLESKPDILCLNETWLSENDEPSNYVITGFNNWAIRNRNSRGDGVMIQCNNTLNNVKEIPNPFNKAFYLNLEMQSFNFKLMALYNPPR